RGGGPLFQPDPGSGFGHAELSEFAGQCRRNGEPVSTEGVLSDLVTEYELDRLIRRAPKGGTVVRLTDADGYTADLYTLSVTPGTTQERQQAGAEAGAPGAGNRWEIWTGQAWEPLDQAGAGA
ncbi:MAG: hypothetical protein QOJ50_3187, partial [Cryptosporangiaceae bacterium]|nr:hypothetical protein [Cryptosporangiaceae bacterium]